VPHFAYIPYRASLRDCGALNQEAPRGSGDLPKTRSPFLNLQYILVGAKKKCYTTAISMTWYTAVYVV